MKDKILFGLFVILAFSVGFTLGGAGKGDDATSTITETASAEQVLASVNKVLGPFLTDYKQRYTDLNTERTKLQAELDAAKKKQAATDASGETVATLKSQLFQQQSEIGTLKASLQNMLNDSASYQQKFLQSQQAVGEAQKRLADSQNTYSQLRSKLTAVNGRTSDTVNEFTAAERTAFYKVWDEWWDLVIDGVD